MLVWPPKDPGEVLDYDLDWTLRLNGDTIATSVWSIHTGSALLITSQSNNATVSKVILSGGLLGKTYTLKNTITTASGDTMIETVTILIKAK